MEIQASVSFRFRKNDLTPSLPPSLKLVCLLQLLDAADSENIGLRTNSRVELTRKMGDWLMASPAAV